MFSFCVSLSLSERVHHAGYVIIQYFPLCLTCHEKPQTPYARVGGQRIESVIPYNTIMAKKASEGRELGAEDKWADTDHHYDKVKAKWKSLTERNWKASMDNIHKVFCILRSKGFGF